MKPILHLPKIEEVDDPPSPAVAFLRGKHLVVEVDKKLRGKERSAAIMAALRAHGYRGIPIAVPLVYLWDPVGRWARGHTGAAVAAAGTGAAVLAAGAALLIPALLDGEEQVTAAPTVVVTVRTTPSPKVRTPEPTPSSTSREPTVIITMPPATPDRTAPEPEPTRSRRPSTAPAPEPTSGAPSTTDPAPTATSSSPPESSGPSATDSPSTGPRPTDPPTSDPPAAEPTITTVSETCTGLVHIEAGDLADICLLG